VAHSTNRHDAVYRHEANAGECRIFKALPLVRIGRNEDNAPALSQPQPTRARGAGITDPANQRRKRGRVVECTGLENRHRGNPVVSSNLTASANTSIAAMRIESPCTRNVHALHGVSRNPIASLPVKLLVVLSH